MAAAYTFSVPEKSLQCWAVYICIHFEQISVVYETLQYSHSQITYVRLFL